MYLTLTVFLWLTVVLGDLYESIKNSSNLKYIYCLIKLFITRLHSLPKILTGDDQFDYFLESIYHTPKLLAYMRFQCRNIQ